MAARITDRKKKRIIADWIEMQSYSAVAKKHGVILFLNKTLQIISVI